MIEAVREREKGEVSVCLYWLDFANMPLRRSYEEVGFRVVTHGRRDDPQFLHRQRSEIQRHARVVSNRVGTAIWYAAACAREVELYGPSFAVGTAEEGAEFDAFQRSEWPELFAGPLAAQPALELGRLELGHEYILPPSDLREVVGWTALRMLAEPAVHSAVAARRIAKRVRNTPRRGVPVAVRAEIGVGRRATRDNVSPDRRAVGVTLFAVSQWRAPTQTFVWREVEAAVSAGVEVAVLSLKRPAASVGSDPPIIYLRPARVSIRLLAEGARRPRRTVATLIDVAMRSSTQTALANLFAAASGLAVQSTIPKPSWIHAHFAWFAGTAAYALSRVSGVPNSVMVHAFDVFDDRFVDRLTAHKLRTAAFVGAESERIAEDVARRFGCRVEVVRMGVPPDFVVETTGPRTSRRVISVGSLVPKKGHDVLLRALAEVPGDWHAAVIGEGPERARLEALLSEYGLLGRVDFPGHLPAERVRRELDSAAVFCLASVVTPTGDRDGVPNVLIEAMARGLPVVAADVSGVPDLLGSDRGIIIRPGRADELADAISRVLADPLAARDRAERALAHVRDHYTTDVNWRRLHALMRMPS
ncbi:MAG: glycosyltransferase [Acidimicrobiales bacterium]